MTDEIVITAETLEESGWRDVLATAKKRICEEYHMPLRNQAAKEEDPVRGRCLMVLSDVCSYHLDASRVDEPFSAVWQSPRGRSAIPSDLSDGDRTALLGFLGSVDDPELKGRIADVLWGLGAGDHTLVPLAVDAYLESARALRDCGSWPLPAERIERATRMALMHGRRNPPFQKCVAFIEDELARLRPDGTFFSSALLELLESTRAGDPAVCAEFAGAAAEAPTESEASHHVITYRALQADFLGRVGNRAGEKEARVAVYRAHEGRADDALKEDPPSNFKASIHLEEALETARRVGGAAEEVERLKARLLETQEKSVGEMKTVEIPLDLSGPAQDAIREVQGKSLWEALVALAAMYAPPSHDELRNRVEATITEHPLHALFGSSIVNRSGRTVAKTEGIDPQGKDPDLDHLIHQEAARGRTLVVLALILPALEQMRSEHRVGEREFMELVRGHPFVPEGRERLFAKGLAEGWRGELAVSVHLLIPQIENSLRYLLRKAGVRTTSIDERGIEKEMPLQTALEHPALADILPPNLIFDLQGLLVEATGDGLRHGVCHGLLASNEVDSPIALYLWWVVLRLIVLPRAQARQAPDSSARDAADAGTEP